MQNDALISFTVVKIDDKYAVLKNKDDNIGNILWPMNKLPNGLKVGSEISLGAGNSVNSGNGAANTDQQYQAMRKLLEDIVN